MEQEEEQLVSACRHHDQRACKQLYDKFAPTMLGICSRYTRDHDAAQDILHDGFIKVFANLKQLRTADSLQAWITSIIIRTAVDSLRVTHTFASLDDDTTSLELRYTAPETFDRYDISHIMTAIQHLPDNQRIAFNMYEIEGYSTEEIASLMDLQPSSVRSAISRARQVLAQELKAYR